MGSRMTLEQLRIFVAVAEREHMTAAARALNVAQSAVSAAIAALEDRHATKLFHRVGRGIALTEAGQLFLTEARAVLAGAHAAATVLDEYDGLKRGTLRIIANPTIAAYWLPPTLAAYRAAYPSIAIELAIGNSKQAAASVRDGAADLGFVQDETNDRDLAQWPIGEDRLMLVGAKSFAGMRIDAGWLRRARWVRREPGSGTRSTHDRHLRARGVDPEKLDVALVLPSNESVRTAVQAGAGVAVLSSLVVSPSIAARTLHAAPIAFPPRTFHALRHKERYRSKAADALLELIGQRNTASSPVTRYPELPGGAD